LAASKISGKGLGGRDYVILAVIKRMKKKSGVRSGKGRKLLATIAGGRNHAENAFRKKKFSSGAGK